MVKITKFFTFCLIVFSFVETFSQIRIHELETSHSALFDSLYSQYSQTRKIVRLNTNWQVYSEGNTENKSRVTIPSAFSGTNELYFETELVFSNLELTASKIYLNCLGIGSAATFILNDNVITKISGSEIPFKILLPEELLYSNEPNRLIIKVSDEPDAKNSIPLKPKFLFGKNTAGIFRDLYLEFIQINGLNDVSINYNLNSKLDKASFKIEFGSKGINLESNPTSPSQIQIELFGSSDINKSIFIRNWEISDSTKDLVKFELNSPLLWSPEQPDYYIAKIRLFSNLLLVDEITQHISLYSIEKNNTSFMLNNIPFELKGVTLVLENISNGNLISYGEIETKLKKLKEFGINSVRFPKDVPSPYALDLCQKYGIFALVELPINSVPEQIAISDHFSILSKEYLTAFTNYISKHDAVLAVGVGSSYLANSTDHISLIEALTSSIKKATNRKTYAGFVGVPLSTIRDLDFYGIELYSNFSDKIKEDINSAITNLGGKSLFFSEVTYPVFMGSTNGYSNPNSFEAQAKFVENVIDYTRFHKLAGSFINTLYDFTGDCASLYTGYNENNLYRIGVLDQNGIADRLTSKVINAKYNNGEKVIIPLGSFKEETPFFFILLSLLLSILLAVVINSKRKFREDATRALLRPYNFYADIRDNRILTGFHSITLMLILAASHALLLTNFLYFFRSNIFIEKLIISLGSKDLLNLVASLAWNPGSAFIKTFLLAILLFGVISVVLKFSSLFVKNRVTIFSIFIIVIWSFIPTVLLLPVELILHKVLTANLVNPWLYGFFFFFALWLFQRLLKGIYVIFDVAPLKVYLFGFLSLIVIVGGYLLYHQFANSSIYYIINAYKQYQLM
ncbi:MAG: hypothetical protein KKA84_05705 [Bacteroidetes bacterium]|nr:hypothetical protein [Bacteroidota bacterium]